MALDVRKSSDAMLFALVAGYNQLKADLAANLTSLPHADITSTTSGGDYQNPQHTPWLITVADATDLPTGIAIATKAMALVAVHFADTAAHAAADTANAIAADIPTDQSTLNTALNELKTDLNLHFAEAGVHHTDDTTNTITAANATDLATSQTLATQIKAKLNAHILAALTAPTIHLIEA